MKILSWNIARSAAAWRELAGSGADIALLQEAGPPPEDVRDLVETDPACWRTEGARRPRPWRAAIARLSGAVEVEWITSAPLCEATSGQIGVSRLGTISAARVRHVRSGEALTLVSMYSLWERPNDGTGSSWIYADASAHRLISDLSALVGHRTNHRIIAAGDLNILFGYGEHGSDYWSGRYATVFERFHALGFTFVGPQSPNGRQAEPWPSELPQGSRNVPTFYTSRQGPGTATRQLDFVFASHALASRVTAKALNVYEHWGPSDHCRIEVEVRNDPAAARVLRPQAPT